MEDIGRVGSRAGRATRLWQLVWPLLFVAGMSALSEYGPEVRDSKTQDSGVPVAAQQVAQWIK